MVGLDLTLSILSLGLRQSLLTLPAVSSGVFTLLNDMILLLFFF